MRAWARDNGFAVADRGRLPAEVVDAYTAGRKKAAPAKQPAKQAPAKPAAARRAATKPAATKPAATKPAATKPAATRSRRAPKPSAAPTTTPATVPATAPDPTGEFADASLAAITADPPVPHTAIATARATSDGELQRLTEQVRALTERVAELESRAAAPPAPPVKSLFRRSR